MRLTPGPAQVLKNIGYCIYCGLNSVPLQREHIIPFGLGGNLIISKASCNSCAKITGQIEQSCLRTMLGAARIHLGLPTRRPKERPEELPLVVLKTDGTTESRVFPMNDFPSALSLLRLSDPDILIGNPPSPNFENASLWYRYRKEEVGAILGTPSVKGLNIAKIHPGHFGRMLAKIAHSYAYANDGMDDFTPLLPDVILGKYEFPSFFVGGSRQLRSAENYLHQLKLRTMSDVDGKDYRIVLIRLFSLMGAPDYVVVAGERSHEAASGKR